MDRANGQWTAFAGKNWGTLVDGLPFPMYWLICWPCGNQPFWDKLDRNIGESRVWRLDAGPKSTTLLMDHPIGTMGIFEAPLTSIPYYKRVGFPIKVPIIYPGKGVG